MMIDFYYIFLIYNIVCVFKLFLYNYLKFLNISISDITKKFYFVTSLKNILKLFEMIAPLIVKEFVTLNKDEFTQLLSQRNELIEKNEHFQIRLQNLLNELN